MERIKVLIFPSGTEGALDIYQALRYNLHFELYGFSGKRNHTDYTYSEGHYFYGDERLFITHPDFEQTFISLLERYRIQYIIPTFDDVTLRLMGISDRLPAKVVTSPYSTVLLASSKKKMYEKVAEFDFAPAWYLNADDIPSYPVFIKPNVGTASQGACLVENRAQLDAILKETPDVVICEYLPGEEVSVDCFTDRHGDLLFIGPRVRERIWHGITMRGRTIPGNEELRKIATQLNRIVTFRGAWFFQAKRDQAGKFKLLEFSVRQATNSALYGKLGVNFPLLSLFDAMDMDVKILFNDYPLEQERRLCASYRIHYNYEMVYVDLDDTLIVQGKVNTKLMRLIYQCINKGVRVMLLTCHCHDLDDTLKAHRLSRDLFDDVIWITDGTPKSDYITCDKAIFIDNYFKERVNVKAKLGIPVFDVDAVDCLLDDSAF